MGDFRKIPDKIGYAEGGSRIPKLFELMNALTDDLELLFGDSDLNIARRKLRGTKEDTVEVDGTITDSISGDEVFGAEVEMAVEDGDVSLKAISNKDGEYAIDAYPGDYDFSISKVGYLTKTQESQTITVDVTKDYVIIPYLKVLETNPEEGEEDVAVDADVVLTFDRDVEFGDDEDAAKAAIIIKDEDDTEYDVLGVVIVDAVATIDVDGPLANGKKIIVTVPVDDSFKADSVDDAPMQDDFVLTFTTIAD